MLPLDLGLFVPSIENDTGSLFDALVSNDVLSSVIVCS